MVNSRDLRSGEGLDTEGFSERILLYERHSDVPQVEELLLLHHDVLGQNVGDLHRRKHTLKREAKLIRASPETKR